MKTYRIGNSITIKWTLKTEDGSPYILNAENTELYATVPNHKIKIEDFTVNDNVLTWIFGGDEQKFFGPYTLTLVQNRGKVGMVTVDSCDAFNLVPWSCLAGGSDTPNINTDSTRLESTVSLSQVGLSPEVQEAINEIITEYNVSNHYPTGGIDDTDRYTLETAIAKIPESLRKVGIKCSFLNEAEVLETWEWQGRSYLSVSNWVRSDISAVNEKIDRQKAEVDAAKNEAMAAIDNREQEALDKFNDQRVTPEMLSEATRQFINSSGGGTITNLPDDEDITSTGGDTPVLKFKDRKPDHGKGYVILRRNKTFAEQVTQANTIYEIRYDFDLDSEFTIPQDCILKFVGGHIRGAKLNLTNTFIDASCIMGILPSQIGGVISNNIAYPEWLADNSTDDYAPLVQSLIDSASDRGLRIKFTAKEYPIHPIITLRSNISLESVSASKLIISTDELYSSVIFSNKRIDNAHIKGLVFEQTAERYSTLDEGGQVARLMIVLYNETHNVIIEGCQFYFNGTNGIGVNGELSDNTIIRNNVLVFKRAHIANDREYDVSAIYITDHYHRIEGNRITSAGGDFNKMGGGIETHGISGIVSNNVFDNCKVCINVVNDIDPFENDEIGRIISSNTASNCNNFVCFWPLSSYPTLKNVKVSNNIVTGIKLSAIRSTINRNTQVNGDIENIIVSDNFFEGIHNDYDGNEYDKNLLDVFNMSTIMIDTAGKVSNFIVERNIIKSFPCSILWMSQYTREGEPRQEVVIKNNTILDCFNATRSIYYAQYYCFALFAAGRNSNVEITDNIIRIPNSITMPPELIYLREGASMKFFNNHFPDLQTRMYYVSKSILEIDLFAEREPKLIYGKEDTYVKGDIIYTLGNKAYCTRGGSGTDVQLTDTVAELENGVGHYTCANPELLKLGYTFSVKIGSTTLLETIVAIVNGKFYTSGWASLKFHMGEDEKLDVNLSFQKAVFSKNTVAVDLLPIYEDKEPGMMYYSLGAKRPSWIDSGGESVDVFGRKVVALHGTLNDRPIAASYGHMYIVTDEGKRKPIWKNSTGADNWISADGFNALLSRRGESENRPAPTEAGPGFTYFDTTLKKMIVCNGEEWVNMDGTALD